MRQIVLPQRAGVARPAPALPVTRPIVVTAGRDQFGAVVLRPVGGVR